jgi:SAM-dependent methyltransferase
MIRRAIRGLLDRTMARRADRLAQQIAPYIPQSGQLLDIGSGTGHNAIAIERRHATHITNLDVVNMRVVGAPPVLFDGQTLPFGDQGFDGALLLFVLHYCDDPLALLREARRVTGGPLVVLQSTYDGLLAGAILRLYDFAWGPIGFALARMVGMVRAPSCRLYARALATDASLRQLFAQAELTAVPVWSERWPLVRVSRTLFVLKRATESGSLP